MSKNNGIKIGLILLILFFFNSISLIQAQNFGKIQGVLQDAVSSDSLLFANVVLVNANDSSQVTGTSSADGGKFEFKKVSYGRYFIQVSMLGYHLTNSSIFVISTEHKEVNIGVLKVQPTSVQLKSVVIRAKRPLMEMETGKIVMNISENIVSQSDNAFDMLKKFPGVSIDNKDNISLNGKSGIMVMIDDRPTYLSGTDLANLLKGMASSTVDKIEAMNNPSSKYDAEGVSGIINIKTTRLKSSGFTGSVFVAAGVGRGFLNNDGFDLNYRNNKVTVYGSFSYYHSDSKSGSESTTNYADGTLFEMNKNKGEEWLTKDKNNGFHGKFGMDYYIDKTNILSVSYRGNGGNGKSNALNNTRVFPKENAPVLYSYSQGSKSKWESQDHNANLNYEHIFDTVFKRKLFVDFNYIKHHRDIEDISDMLYYQGDFQKEDTTSMYALEAPLSSDIYALKLDYEHPFTQQTKLEVGLKFSFVDNHNQMEYNTAGIIDTNRSNAYRYNELIGAAYAIVNHSFKTKTSLQVGLRAEYTHTMGKSENLDSINTRSYWRPFPNISISQQIGTKNQLSLSYRYRLTRPHYTYLNPFLLRGGVNSYSSGNPLLNPEYSHVLDLSYSFNYKFFATLSYTHSDGMIDYITVYSKEYIAFSQPKNMGRSDQLSLSLSTQLTFFKIWRLNLYLYGGYGRTELFYQDKWRKTEAFNASYWISTSVDILPTFTLEVSSWGQLPSRSLFTTNHGYYSLSTALKKTFLENTLTLSLGADIRLNTYSNSSIYPDGTYSSGDYRWNGTSGWVRLSYRFGNNTASNNRAPRTVSSDSEESSRLGGNGGGSIGK